MAEYIIKQKELKHSKFADFVQKGYFIVNLKLFSQCVINF